MLNVGALQACNGTRFLVSKRRLEYSSPRIPYPIYSNLVQNIPFRASIEVQETAANSSSNSFLY